MWFKNQLEESWWTISNDQRQIANESIYSTLNNKLNNQYNVLPDVYEEMEQIKNDAVEWWYFLQAPNWRPSNLDKKLWLLVRTKNFKEWFGDRENDKENSSKVVDENGEPLVVYHATKAKFTVFDSKFSGTGSGNTKNTEGVFYFSKHKETAIDVFGPNKEEIKLYNVMPVFLNLKNPNILPLDEFNKTWHNKIKFNALKKGDGIIAIPKETPEEIYERKLNEYNKKINEGGLGRFDFKPASVDKFFEEQSDHCYVAFNPNQIKSTDNYWSFSNSDNNIKH